LMVGTDGVGQLMQAENELVPGTDKKVGHVSRFWTESALFTKDDEPQRLDEIFRNFNSKIYRMNRKADKPRLDIFPGLVEDDFTMVVARRVS